ncbi:MAG: hypothetical protein R2751_06440 [Bacteroidales bacterium]
MKPLRIFLFFLGVFALLALLAWGIPDRGIQVAGILHLDFYQFTRPGPDSLPDARETAVRLLAGSSVTSDPEYESGLSLFSEDEADGTTKGDSVTGPSAVLPFVAPVDIDSLRASTQRIEVAPELQPRLDDFFLQLEALGGEGGEGQTRILHYGDSQIENDRMTALLRFRLQKHFGGSGTGLVPAVPLYSGNMAFQQEIRGKWLRYTYFGKRDTSIRHRSYGAMGAFASVPVAGEGSWPGLTYRFNTRRQTGQVEQVKVFLHSYVERAAIAYEIDENLRDTLRGLPSGFSVATLAVPEGMEELRLDFRFPQGGRIYGISFESRDGIQVDNIAMRGGSGLIFSKMDRENLARMMDRLSPGMLLLQFGGNAVPYINPSFYYRTFSRELRTLRDLCPAVPVIVIGPADMSIKEGGEFVTNPNLEPVRDALKRAALDNGVGFWDLYEAMGGENSMPSFVQSDPPLASADHVHFTPLGGNLVAEMFYKSLMLEYAGFQEKRKQP